MKRKLKGFTLVELVITIAIVIILSVISVPIYRGYVDKAKWSEGYALLGTILSAQKAYYSEYGNFLSYEDSSGKGHLTSYETVLGIDIRGNKYFTLFTVGAGLRFGATTYFHAVAKKPIEISKNGNMLLLQYNLTKGSYVFEGASVELDGDSSFYGN